MLLLILSNILLNTVGIYPNVPSDRLSRSAGSLHCSNTPSRYRPSDRYFPISIHPAQLKIMREAITLAFWILRCNPARAARWNYLYVRC